MQAALAARPLPDHLPLDHDLGDGLMAMTWVMLAISTVFVAARTISKLFILRRFRLDDVLLLLTWVSCTIVRAVYLLRSANALYQVGALAYSVFMQLSYHNGFGRHSRKQSEIRDVSAKLPY